MSTCVTKNYIFYMRRDAKNLNASPLSKVNIKKSSELIRLESLKQYCLSMRTCVLIQQVGLNFNFNNLKNS